MSFEDWTAIKEHESRDWIIVARHHEIGNSDFRTFSVLASTGNGNLDKILSTEDWDIIRLGTPMNFGRPYFELSDEGALNYNSGQSATIEGVEFQPFTLYHTHHGYIPHRFELVQNFLLFTDAFYDNGAQKYVRINDVGELEPVAKYESDDENILILVDAHLLRDYLAANRSYLVRYHDHRRWTTDDITNQIQGEFKKIPIVNTNSIFELLLRTDLHWDDKKSSSRLLGKDIVHPYPELDKRHKYRITGQIDKRYAKFIIDRNDEGEEIEASCNEETLSNFFTDRGEAHFFTSVFFTQNLLTKYRTESSRYQVGKSGVSCLDLWSIEIDITEEGLVHVWLGDLGRIPYKEQMYWRQFNVAPRGEPTLSRLKRDFANEIIESNHELEIRAAPLEKSSFLKALELILRTGQDMERRASTYNEMKETALRDVLLTSLNVHFEGLATGETFSRRGKTDIYIPFSEGHPLILECKIWGGPSRYQNAIAQLFGYLTVRDEEGVIVTFCKEGDFTSILKKAQAAVENDSTYITESWNLMKSEVAYTTANHKHPSDSQRSVKIHHIFITLI